MSDSLAFKDLENWATWRQLLPNGRVLTKFCWAPLQQLKSRESPAGFICLGLNLSPLIYYRNLKTHFLAIPVSLPSLWVCLGSGGHRTAWKFQEDEWTSPRTEALLQKEQKDFLDPRLSTHSHLSSFLPPSTSIHLQNNWYALGNLGNYCLLCSHLCSHLCSQNLLNFSAHAEWFKYDPTVKVLIALAFLHFFPLSTGWIDNSQTPVSSTQNAGSIIDHSDPLVESVRNFSQVPEGKWSSTRDSRFRMVLYRVRIFYFPVEENSNVSCLTLPLATEEY